MRRTTAWLILPAAGILAGSLTTIPPLIASPAAAPQSATLTVARTAQFVDEGDSAQIRIRLESDRALTAPVTIRYTAGQADGSVTFPAGSAAGSVRTVSVVVPRDGVGEAAQRIPVRLSATGSGVQLPNDRASVVVNAHGLPYLNVGDEEYDPLYPFGWGLRTDAPGGMVAAARAAAQTAIGSGQAGVPADAAALFAQAERTLLRGETRQAIQRYAQAGGVDGP